jgi:flavin-dependent dehydrogenase
VVERSHYQEWRAGETLDPKVSIPLSKLGAMNSLVNTPHIASQAIHSAWGDPKLVEHHSISSPYGTGWHIDRSKFDSSLAAAAADRGARVLRKTCYISALRGDLWRITLRNECDTFEVKAKLLVDATGRVSQVARSLGSRGIFYDQLIALVGILASNSLDESVESSLTLEAVEDGWWYMVPLPTGRILLAFMTDKDIFLGTRASPSEYWLKLIKKTEHLSSLLERYHLTDDVLIRNASTFRLDKMAGVGWIAVGDAACAFDPLAGNGILKALVSGIDASVAVARHPNESNAFDNYDDSVRKMFNNYLVHRTEFYQREKRWRQSPFWLRRHEGMIN